MSRRIAKIPTWLHIVHLLATIAMLVVSSWGLLASNPLAAVRGTPLHFVYFINDFVIHVSIYTVLTCLLLPLVATWARRVEWVAVSLIAAHAIGTEFLQILIPRRTCDPLDMVANLAGIVVALRLLPHVLQMTTVVRELVALQAPQIDSSVARQ